MGDDLFDQIVEDAIAEESRREEADAVEPAADEAADVEVDEELLAIDEPDDDESTSTSSFALNAAEERPEPSDAKPAATAKPKKESKAVDSRIDGGDSAIDGKGAGKSALPLCTGSFTHRDYQVSGTLSMVSARRVVQTGGWETADGRSTDGEKAIANAEREVKMELRAQAAKRGGNAVVGVSVQLATPGGGLLVLQATGTPVRLKKRAERK